MRLIKARNIFNLETFYFCVKLLLISVRFREDDIEKELEMIAAGKEPEKEEDEEEKKKTKPNKKNDTKKIETK